MQRLGAAEGCSPIFGHLLSLTIGHLNTCVHVHVVTCSLVPRPSTLHSCNKIRAGRPGYKARNNVLFSGNSEIFECLGTRLASTQL